MRTKLSSYVLSMGAAAALLAACGESQPPIAVPNAMPQSRAVAARSNIKSYKVVYSFGALPDGNNPLASLIDVGGTLYGTTLSGGAYISCFEGCGTVFSVTPSGSETVVYSFDSGRYGGAGGAPDAGLIDVGGTLYGTASNGGYSSYICSYFQCGTVFSITPSGTVQVLHKFGAGADGLRPQASLIEVNGKFYGTTSAGGAYQGNRYGTGGTAFSITLSGTEKVLHSFGHGADGTNPHAPLIDVKGKLYGTTTRGGRYDRGTVFSITLNGREKVLHSFGKGADGCEPYAGLIDVKGTLYGTTFEGGSTCGLSGNGCGTIFTITTGGTENVLYRFHSNTVSGTDGCSPQAPLIEVKGRLYGTTAGGGASSGCTGCGTVFRITLSGKEKVLHSFAGGSDGAVPKAGLIDVGGTLYGTTSDGGTSKTGTVFALTP